MIRPLTFLAMVVIPSVILTAGAGTAQARRQICEPDPDTSILPDAIGDTAARADDDRPLPAPLDRTVCVPGYSDDAACWPVAPLPEPGPPLSLGSFPNAVLGRRVPLVPPPRSRWLRAPAQEQPITDGFSRRIDRPPRPVSASV